MEDVLEANGRIYEIEYISVDSNIAKAKVEDEKVIIKVPKRYLEYEKAKIIESLKIKIQKKLVKDPYWGMLRYPKFYDGQEINLLGEKYVVRIEEGGEKARGKILGNEFVIKLPNEDKKKELKIMLKLTSKAKLAEVKERVLEINKKYFGFEVKKVKLKYAMNRWGSCNSHTKIININFLMLMAPESILDYLIIHELAHLKEPNHSERFWKLVESACPEYKERARWLRKNGRFLGSGRLDETKKEINILI
ncbi:MAG: M48 family metallopeptidase [Candidatus Micrarchaeia archaeon]